MKTIKTIMLLLIGSMLTTGFCKDAFTFVNSADGYSYIQINENIESFTFKTDWHSIGNAGKVGYVVYAADMNDADRAVYMEANANNPQFRKNINGGIVDLGSLNAGDRVGFYEVRPNGRVYTQSSFEDWNDKTWLAFDKNDSHGKDEWMSIVDVNAVPASYENNPGGSSEGSTGGIPSGAPLPGALTVLLVGGVAAGAYKAGKKH